MTTTRKARGQQTTKPTPAPRKTSTRKPNNDDFPPAPTKAKPAVKPKPAPSNCGCGCGAPTITAKAAFLPGHDARLAGVLGRAIGSGTATADQAKHAKSLSTALQAKVESIAKTERERLAKRAARKAAQEAAKAAFAAAMAS